jgi:hypothetical protein
MTEKTLSGLLNEIGADTDTVHQTLRYYITERIDDLSSEQQRRRVAEFIGDEAKLDDAIRGLERDPVALEAVALFVLSQAWDEPEEAELIAGAASDAKVKLPVVEAYLLNPQSVRILMGSLPIP